jgi:hypothetical protein
MPVENAVQQQPQAANNQQAAQAPTPWTNDQLTQWAGGTQTIVNGHTEKLTNHENRITAVEKKVEPPTTTRRVMNEAARFGGERAGDFGLPAAGSQPLGVSAASAARTGRARSGRASTWACSDWQTSGL